MFIEHFTCLALVFTILFLMLQKELLCHFPFVTHFEKRLTFKNCSAFKYKSKHTKKYFNYSVLLLI